MSELVKLTVCGVVGITLLGFAPALVRANEMDDYQRSFDLYRTAYSAYEVKKADFNQSQTFAAEEDLLNSAKNMLMLRTDTWSNYWKAAYNRFTTVASASTDTKAGWKSFFDTEISWLSIHKDELTKQKTRSNLLQVSQQLDAKNETYLSKAFQLNVDIVSGRLTDAINQVRVLNQTLMGKAKKQIADPTKQDVTITGLNSNLERLDQLEFDMAVVKQDFMDESGFADSNRFSAINEDFKPLYQKLIQIMSVTRELSGNVQW